MKNDLPLPEGPNTNLLRFVVMPRFIGRSLMSRCSGFPVSLSTILMPKGESELRSMVLWRGTHSMLASWLPTSFFMCFSPSASSLHAMTLKCARTEVSP